jgi:DNA-binding NtrC family response regulator
MAYLFRQKLDLREFAGIKPEFPVVLVAEPEEDLLALYSYYLQNSDFTVKHCSQVKDLAGLLLEHQPHLLVFNPKFFQDIFQAAALLNSVRDAHPSMPVITVSRNLSGEELKQLMVCGIASHIDRQLRSRRT